MQTFSRVQRNLSDQKTLTHVLALTGLMLFYPSMEALYPLLPPLLGLAYVQWSEAVHRRDYFQVMAWMLYALIFESVWDLPLYGIWAVMIVTMTVFDPAIRQILHSRWLNRLIGATLFDLLYLLFLLGYGAVMHTEVIRMDWMLFYYLLVDMVGVVLF